MRAALYLRVSTDQQAERFSLSAQRRQLTEFCDREGWTYKDLIYEDAGLSGETIDARPAMRRLIEDILARKVDVVLAVEMERFSRARDGVDLALFKRVCREAGVRFGTPAQLFNPDDVEDDFVSGLLGLLAAREKSKIVERTARGRVEAARRGRFVAAVPPYGYCRATDGQLVVYEPEAEAVRFMFRRLAEGRSLYGIVDDLNVRGFRPRRAGRWTKGSVWGILKNPAYGGNVIYRRTKSSVRPEQRRPVRPESEWVRIPVPRIVSDELVRLVSTRLADNARMAARNQKHFWLLRGLVFCGVCGHLMSGKIAGGYRFYCCQASRARARGIKPRCRWHAVPAQDLDEWVWDQVVRALQAPELVLEEARRARESQINERDELTMRLSYVEEALSKLPLERERALSLFREGYATIEEIRVQLTAVDRKCTELTDERSHLLAKLGTQLVDEAQAVRLDQVLSRVQGRLASLTDTGRFEVVHTVVIRAVVYRDRRVEIEACVPLAVKGPSGWVRELAVATVPS